MMIIRKEAEVCVCKKCIAPKIQALTLTTISISKAYLSQPLQTISWKGVPYWDKLLIAKF